MLSLVWAWARRGGRLRGEHGTSLMEVTMAAALLAMVVGPAAMFLASTQRSEKIVEDASRQQGDARVALEALSRSLREGGYAQGLDYSSSSVFSYAADNEVTFYSDVDNDNVTEKVRYWLDTTTSVFNRTVIEPSCAVNPCDYTSSAATSTTSPLLPNVRNADATACSQGGIRPLFVYYRVDRGNGVPTLIPTPISVVNDLVDISYVKTNVVVDITPGKSPTCQALETAVSLRNWRG